MNKIIRKLLQNKSISYQFRKKYQSTTPTPTTVYNTIIDISTKLTLKSLAGTTLRV